MVYTCEGCEMKGELRPGLVGDVYPRMVFSRQSAVLCGPCKDRLEDWLTSQWREWFVIQRRTREKAKKSGERGES